MSDIINPNWIAHLKNNFRTARPILFTGSGFSSGAKNIAGESVPTVQRLKEKIWEQCFPEDPFVESTLLQDLYEHALLRSPNMLRDLMLQSLTVTGESVPDWYEPLFSLPWQRCYTLNVDNLDVAVSQRFELPRTLLPVSATALISASPNPSAKLEVVHLNGTLEDLPESVTFSTTQYAERLSKSEPWYLQFAADLLTAPVVFIGTGLNEGPLWQHIVLRHGRGSDAILELRQRSYLVTPELDRPRETLLSQYNVVWVPLTVETFATEVLPELLDTIQPGLAELSQRSAAVAPTTRLVEVADLATDPHENNEFLLGQEPIWADIQSDRAILRECDNELSDVVSRVLGSSDIRGTVLISGTAGSGKSTSLMRLCLKLVADGSRVAWIDRSAEVSPTTIRDIMKSENAPTILAIDDADLFGSGLSILLRDVCQYHSRPLIVMAIRSGRIDRALNPVVLEQTPQVECVMPHLSDPDIDALIDLLDREHRLGMLAGKDRKHQTAVFRELSGRQLLVAMIKATSGEWLEERAVSELIDLDATGARIYAHVAVAFAHRFFLKKEEVLIALGQSTTNLTLNALDQLVHRNILIERRGDYQARHRIIAEIIRDRLHEQGQMVPVVRGLSLVAAVKVTPRSRQHDRHMRMLRVFLNHDMLLRTVGESAAKNIYANLEDPLSWNHHYWLQRGSLELERGSLTLAENFLGSAIGLAPDDPFVRNEWAYLQFKKAHANPTAPDSNDLAQEATRTLEDLIAGGQANQYPYGVLGRQGLIWASHGMVNSRERGIYLRELIDKIELGLEKFPREPELRQLKEDLKRAYLETAL